MTRYYDEGPFERDPIFEGQYDPRTGWTGATFSPRTDTFANRYLQSSMPGPAGFRPALDPMMRGLPEYVEASTDTDCAVYPPLIWDTNRYYRLLGVRWLDYRTATIRQMTVFYRERGGPDDEAMTYALKQLRDKTVRREYNATPIGQMFMDVNVEAWLKRRALSEARRRQGAMFDPEDGEAARKILQEWGFLASDSEDEDEEIPEDAAPDELEQAESAEDPQIPWTYSYYVWRSNCDDTDRLGRWQELLVKAFVRVGVKRRFAVGFMGRQPQEWVAGEVGARLIAFLHEDVEPTEEMAAKMVASVDGSM